MYHAFLTQTIPLSNQIADESKFLFLEKYSSLYMKNIIKISLFCCNA